jgi:uncharacterized protein DUF4386
MKKLATTAGAVYILAWIVGLVVASGGPKPDDPATKVASYFAGHEHSAMLGHLLIDGIAALALVVLGIVIHRFLSPSDPQMAKLGLSAALAAAATSFAQFVLGVTFTYDAAHDGSPKTVRDLFVALNNADTVKIVFLAAMITTVSIAARRTGVLPRWFADYGFASAPLLAISGFAFPFNSDALLALLELTLLLLLVWVAIFTAQVRRRTSSPGGADRLDLVPLTAQTVNDLERGHA